MPLLNLSLANHERVIFIVTIRTAADYIPTALELPWFGSSSVKRRNIPYKCITTPLQREI
jgi:hypothetical protein